MEAECLRRKLRMMFRAENAVNAEPINRRHAPTVPGEDPTICQHTLGVAISVSDGELMMKPLQDRQLSHSSGYSLLQYLRSRKISTFQHFEKIPKQARHIIQKPTKHDKFRGSYAYDAIHRSISTDNPTGDI